MGIVKKLLIVSHCILNNASKVEQDEVELAGEYELRSELLNLIVENNIQLIQLPCPEFIMYGSQRWGHVKNVSVEGSPNCGYHLTCEGNWKGEIGSDEKRICAIQNSLEMTEKPGVYMEILEKEIHDRELSIPIMTMAEAIELLNKL